MAPTMLGLPPPFFSPSWVLLWGLSLLLPLTGCPRRSLSLLSLSLGVSLLLREPPFLWRVQEGPRKAANFLPPQNSLPPRPPNFFPSFFLLKDKASNL